MTGQLRGIIVGHGGLAEALTRAVEEITGMQGVLVPVSNRDCDRTRLEERVLLAIGSRPAIVFVDLRSGSCFVAARRLMDRLPDVRVVSGVNLAMLLDFVMHPSASAEEAAVRAGEVGKQGIGEQGP